MSWPKVRLPVIQVSVIVLVSLAASYGLLGARPAAIVAFLVLAALGIITAVVLRLSGLLFGAGALIMIVPALMKLNNVKWWAFTEERLDFCPTLNLPVALAIGLLVVCGTLVLDQVGSLRRDLRTLARGKAEDAQIRGYAAGQGTAISAATLISAAIAVLVVIIIEAVRGTLTGWLRKASWSLPVAGAALLVALALAVFWLANRRHADG